MTIASHKARALQAAIQQNLLNEKSPLLALVTTQGIQTTAKALQAAFPQGSRHCFAVKSNPYLGILTSLQAAGMGAEVASIPELELALKAGFLPPQIVYDAPVKTPQEISRALSLGIDFNMDNFQELERVAQFMAQHSAASNIGFRINPQIGAGQVESTSTATLTSKFGIGLKDNDNRMAIINACRRFPWINTLHVHVGSVACPLSLMTQGVSVIYDLATEINAHLKHRQITRLDIGGGLPVDFSQDGDNPSFTEYAEALEQAVPQLLSGEYHITTEFGRALLAKNAITAGRVEYTKSTGGQAIALTHIGVQTLVRTVYEPEHWQRRISAFDAQGNLKSSEKLESYDIAGPACFSGDLIARKRLMPPLQPGDYVLVHDTGAYHFSNHYQYNALPRPPVYAYTIKEDNEVEFSCISQGQSIADVLEDYS